MIEVRPESSCDAGQIRAVHLQAFPTKAEADLVEQLKGEGDAVISLVATDESEIVGHVLFSRMAVDADGKQLQALGLAPVAVLPTHQGKGVGTALIQAGLSAARTIETDIVFVVGEPEYYCRFGFDARIAATFMSPYAGQYFQALAFRDDYQAPSRGRADYAPAFAGLE